MLGLAIAVVVALVAVSAVLGLIWRSRTGRVRTIAADRVDLAALGVSGGSGATLLQLSTRMCATCRPAAALLGRIAAATPGVVHAEVLLDERPDLVDRFAVRQTPTVLLLDARASVRGRISGAPREAEVVSALDELLEAPRVPIR